MKLKVLTLLMFMFTLSFNLMATNPLTTISSDVKKEAFDLVKHQASTTVFGKIKNWFNKKITKIKTWITKKMLNFDFEDSNSVLKMWIIAILLGAICYTLSATIFLPTSWIFARLGYLFWSIGFIMFCYWIYLKYVAES